MPVEYSQLLESSKQTQGFRTTIAFAEAEIAIDGFSGPRNSDMVVVGEAKEGRVCLAVEAKADETFAKTIKDELLGLSEASNKPNRISNLANAIFQRDLDEHVMTIRYQLLHSLAATAIESRRQNARLGVLLIHEFISLNLDFEKVARNAFDLKTFAKTIPGWENESVATGKLLPPITLRGNQYVPSDRLVTIGKIRTLIPLDADEREKVRAGYDTTSRQFVDGVSKRRRRASVAAVENGGAQ